MTMATNSLPPAATPPTPEGEPVPSLFRVGRAGETVETFVDGVRTLSWMPSEYDEIFEEAAGWTALPHGRYESGLAYIEIPEGTRSASSILGGKEAWPGEKAEILAFIADYIKRPYERTGYADTNLSLDTVAITKEDRKIFVTPPHQALPARQQQALASWFAHLVQDIHSVLSTDRNKEAMIEEFIARIGQLTPPSAKV